MKRNYSIYLSLMLALIAMVILGCSKTEDQVATPKANNLTQPLQSMLDNNFSFSYFDTLMKKTGYYDQVAKGDSAYTLLIPDNDAFTAANMRLDSLLRIPLDSLKQFVGYHILKGSVTTATIPQTITNPRFSITRQTLYFSKPLNGAVTTLHINGMQLRQVDLVATNGIVQVLATPLRVPASSVKAWLVGNANYSYYVAALKKFNLLDQLDKTGPYTVLAPDNSAFVKNGITMDFINSDTFDVKHFNPFLFTAGILSGRIFNTDFGDAPVAGNGVTFTKDGTVTFSAGYYGDLSSVATNYVLQDRYNYTQIGGRPSEKVFEQQPAINGVVHHMNDLLVYPNMVYLPQ